MNICISPAELRKAIADVEAAEANGFHYCLCVFRLSRVGQMLDENLMDYSDLIEKAHPTDGRLNWGRFQGVSRRNEFVRGKLVPLTKEGAA